MLKCIQVHVSQNVEIQNKDLISNFFFFHIINHFTILRALTLKKLVGGWVSAPLTHIQGSTVIVLGTDSKFNP